MIQTQLLKLDPPYQIISANGYVGIQVATLIVAEEKEAAHVRLSTFSRSYIEYHSYPVVNYGLKQGLEEQMKYTNSYLDDVERSRITMRMQPEGAVWDGVDVKDVRVLGLAGASNENIDLSYFVYLIPSVRGFDPSLHVWDRISTSRIFDLYTGLAKVGLKTQKLSAKSYHTPCGDEVDENREFRITLSIEEMTANDARCIKVLIREKRFDIEIYGDESIYFRCLVDPSTEDSVNECAATIAEALHGLSWFLPTRNLKLLTTDVLTKVGDSEVEFMPSLIDQINENYKNLR